MDIFEAIDSRHSVRQYKPIPLSSEHKKALIEKIEEINSESGLEIQLVADEPKAFDCLIAKYGNFSGVKNYIAMVGKKSEKLDMVINLEPWDNDKVYDRMGANDVYTQILDVEVPLITIPVQPGRNLAVIVEVAAMNNRQKRMGENAAIELMERLSIPMIDDDDLAEWDSYFGLDE